MTQAREIPVGYKFTRVGCDKVYTRLKFQKQDIVIRSCKEHVVAVSSGEMFYVLHTENVFPVFIKSELIVDNPYEHGNLKYFSMIPSSIVVALCGLVAITDPNETVCAAMTVIGIAVAIWSFYRLR
jgi:hypothetical protein